ncbi:MAG: TCR/Tet family MFS transporter [Chloroflexi bacterium]|nr:TCR/Tet family MFS transporter [Chloroflexota bacterium]
MPIRFKQFLRSPFFPIFMIVFVDILGFAITIPVLPLYVQGEFRGTAVQITSLTALFFGTQLVAMPGLGRLSDRIGRRPVLIISQFGSFLALLMSGLAPNLGYLFLSRVIDGFTGGNISVAQAYLSDITDEKNRTQGMGVVSAALNSSILIGPAFGSLIAARFGPRAPFLIASAVALGTILLSILLLPKTPPPSSVVSTPKKSERASKNLSAILVLPGMALLLFIALGDRIAFFLFQPTWVLWIERVLLPDWDVTAVQKAVGWLLTVSGAAGIAAQIWLVGPLTAKLGEKQMVIGGTVMRSLAWGMMVLFPFIPPTAVGAMLIGAGGGISMPAMTSLATYIAPPKQQGYAIGVFQSSKGIGRIIGSIMSGVIFQYVSPMATLTSAAIISAALLVVMFKLPRREM